jgi:hypothetical protein
MRKSFIFIFPVTLRGILFVCMAVMIAVIACRKMDRQPTISDDALEQKFFYSHRSGSNLEKSIVSFMQRENNKYHFVGNIVNRVGFPYWNKAIIISDQSKTGRGQGGESATFVLIPFVRNTENQVNSVLLI